VGKPEVKTSLQTLRCRWGDMIKT